MDSKKFKNLTIDQPRKFESKWNQNQNTLLGSENSNTAEIEVTESKFEKSYLGPLHADGPDNKPEQHISELDVRSSKLESQEHV